MLDDRTADLKGEKKRERESEREKETNTDAFKVFIIGNRWRI